MTGLHSLSEQESYQVWGSNIHSLTSMKLFSTYHGLVTFILPSEMIYLSVKLIQSLLVLLLEELDILLHGGDAGVRVAVTGHPCRRSPHSPVRWRGQRLQVVLR